MVVIKKLRSTREYLARLVKEEELMQKSNLEFASSAVEEGL